MHDDKQTRAAQHPLLKWSEDWYYAIRNFAAQLDQALPPSYKDLPQAELAAVRARFDETKRERFEGGPSRCLPY